MSTMPPSPFLSSASAEQPPVETAAALVCPPGDNAAADIPLSELVKRGFDEEGFLNDLEQLPAFLVAPSQEYLRQNELESMLKVLAEAI